MNECTTTATARNEKQRHKLRDLGTHSLCAFVWISDIVINYAYVHTNYADSWVWV